MASDSESQKIETYNATVHMNSRVYYVTIPMDTVRKLSIKRDDLVMIKIAHTSPPDGFWMTWGEAIKAAIDEIVANPSKYRDGHVEIILDSDRVVAHEGDPEYDEGFYNELMTVRLN